MFDDFDNHTRRPVMPQCFELDRLTVAVVVLRMFIVEACRRGDKGLNDKFPKVQLIKMVRDLTSWSLKDSKDFVEMAFAVRGVSLRWSFDCVHIDGADYPMESVLTDDQLTMLLSIL